MNIRIAESHREHSIEGVRFPHPDWRGLVWRGSAAMPRTVITSPDTSTPVDRLALRSADVRSGDAHPSTHNYAADWCMADDSE